jgi:NAD(P)H-hydrate epimerase
VKPVLTAEEYRRVDKAYQGDLDQAMDRAGLAVALAAARNGAGYGSRVIVLAGPGNNGGDGYVAARYLRRRGAQVVVHALGAPRAPEAIRAAALAGLYGVPVVELGPVIECDLVIDALFGGGARGGLPAVVSSWMDAPIPVVAVDFPTGLDPSTGLVDDRAFRAVETITFQTLKTGHVRGEGPDYCGVVTVVDIGMEGGEPSMLVAEEVDAPRPPRSRTAHKWSAGSVLVVGGSTGMVGAAVLAGRSALNFGAGSVVVASPRADLVTAAAPELLARPLEDAGTDLDRFDVVIAGPGLAGSDRSAAMTVLRKASRVVLDAGALEPSMVEAAREGEGEVVVTPHAGEFARIAGVESGAFSARAYAEKTGVTVLLKGNPTTVTDGSLPVLVRSGGPELASIGTGDVLAGMIGALWARGLDAGVATVSAAYWHGIAGADLAGSTTVTAPTLAGHVGRFAFPPATERGAQSPGGRALG